MGWKAIPMPMPGCMPSPTRSWAASAQAISASISRPPTNAGAARRRWKFLDHAASLVAAKGGAHRRIVDVTLICERPKIGPHRDAMRAQIAEILKLDHRGSA